jgi:hypothetical protein
MFGVTGGYHRYFAHRSFKTSRVFHVLLAALAQSSVQKGVLWWASHHRMHHKFSDEPNDVHSAKQDGFWWSHVGWILSSKHDGIDRARVRDLSRHPELRFMDRFWYLSPIAYAVVLYLCGGWWAFFWGFFVSTVLVWHGTFLINSLAHLVGRRRYATADDSRAASSSPCFAWVRLTTTITTISAPQTGLSGGDRSHVLRAPRLGCSASCGTCTFPNTFAMHLTPPIPDPLLEPPSEVESAGNGSRRPLRPSRDHARRDRDLRAAFLLPSYIRRRGP